MCVCVWGGGACATFELKRKEKKAGEQFPELTEASLDSLSRFFSSMILCETEGPFVCLWVCDIIE